MLRFAWVLLAVLLILANPTTRSSAWAQDEESTAEYTETSEAASTESEPQEELEPQEPSEEAVSEESSGKTAYVSTVHTWYYQPKSFEDGKLIVTVEPFRDAKEIEWFIPKDIDRFKPLLLIQTT